MIKHATVSAYIFCYLGDAWRVGLIMYPRIEKWHPPGGHVEPYETPEVAVFREVIEETGIDVGTLQLVVPDEPPLPIEALTPRYRQVATPWWIVEEDVSADNTTHEPHFHIDHHYLMLRLGSSEPEHHGQHHFDWFDLHDLQMISMHESFRAIALELFKTGQRPRSLL